MNFPIIFSLLSCTFFSYCQWCQRQVQAAVFDLPEEIAKELLSKQTPPGNTITRISKVV